MTFSHNSEPRIIYMGTPEISAHVLEEIIGAGFHVVAVITNEDKEVGRKKEKEPTPVKKVALSHDIPVYQPHRIRKEYEFISAIPCDLILTMAYGHIVPDHILSHPKYGCLNLHGSLLPELRGAAPIQRAIMEGKKKTGVTLMEMVATMDAGRMYAKEEVEIAESDNFTSLAEKISNAAAKLAINSILPYLNGALPGIEQDESKVTFANKILPEDEHLPIDLPVEELLSYIRALSLKPGAYLLLDGLKLKIYSASLFSKETIAEIGVITKAKKGLYFQANGGIVSIESLQLEGKKAMDGKSFVNGMRDLEGKKLY